MRPLDGRLYLLFTPSVCTGDPWETLEQAILGGVDLVQWRQKDRDPTDLARCMHVCRQHAVPVVVNDHVDLAVALDAQGAHVGQDDMKPRQARKALGKERWLGVSTHSLAQLAAAEKARADYVGFGPCFATETKGYAEGLERELISQAAAAATVPLFAIGGIHRHNLPLLRDLGVERIAVSAAILTAPRPFEATQQLRRQLP